MTRATVEPRADRTVHAFGDIHINNIITDRKTNFIQGLSKAAVTAAPPVAHLQLGDETTNGISSEDADVLAFLASFPDGGSIPLYKVLGNHDVLSDVRTPDEAAAALGLEGRNYTVELDFAHLVAVYPGDTQASSNNGSIFSAGCLSWLDTTLQGLTDKDVWILCHFPIYDTVVGDSATHWNSTDSGFFLAGNGTNLDSSGYLALLADYPQVKVQLSGHTHSDITTPGLLSMVRVGSRQLAHINTSSVLAPNKGASRFQELSSFFITHRDDSSIEVRLRNHNGGGYWNTINGERVTVMSPT